MAVGTTEGIWCRGVGGGGGGKCLRFKDYSTMDELSASESDTYLGP